jgi:hypothetical protein
MTEERPPGDRPRWSFTWLMRIQRISRDRAERQTDGEVERKSTIAKVIGYVILGIVIAAEIWFGVYLGLLPR